MTRRIPISLVCLLALLQPGCKDRAPQEAVSLRNDSRSQEAASVRTCFEGYKQAILDQDGKAAVAFVDWNTLKYYGKMRTLALEGKPDAVRKLSTIDKLMVLMLRHRIPVEVLADMTAASLFVHAVNEGWIGRESVINNELGDIVVSGIHATGVHISDGNESPFKWIFRKENADWRIDITSIMPIADQAFKQLVQESGQSEDDFLFSIIESVSGKKLTERIWEPMAGAP